MNLLKNWKKKVYLGLMLGLVSIPAHASLETWAQKNGLIIPSSETQLTLRPDSRDKLEIMMGFECCWDKKHIENVQKEYLQKSIKYKSKVNLKKLEFIRPPDKVDYALFFTIQALDIYSTHKATKYKCVVEVNPLLPKEPTIAEMTALKTAILAPVIITEEMDKDTIRFVNSFTIIAAANNFDILRRARKYC